MGGFRIKINQGVPILLDEVCSGEPRGSRPAMSLEDIKHMAEVQKSSTLDGRTKDISFSTDQARVFTTNAEGPHGWHKSLPKYVFAMENAERVALHPDVKAIFKRAVFAHVDRPLVPATTSTAFSHNRRSEASSSGAEAMSSIAMS